MTKIQTIIGLFILLLLLVSMDLIFGSPILETFKGSKIVVTSRQESKKKKRTDTFKQYSINPESDDQPLQYGLNYNKTI